MPNDAADDARAETCATLLGLAELAVETEAAERRIMAGAQDRLDQLRAEFDGLRPAATDREVEGRYLEVTEEVRQLEGVISRAREVLG